MQQDFAPFGEVMHKVTNREVKKNYEIYLCALSGRDRARKSGSRSTSSSLPISSTWSSSMNAIAAAPQMTQPGGTCSTTSAAPRTWA
jgi:hypothetical protein